jgi:Peptidase propeptide and YPEB domain
MEFSPAALINKLIVLLTIFFLTAHFALAGSITGTIPAQEPISLELMSRVKFTAGMAVQKVEAAFPGVVTEVALEIEDGYLVYEVESNGLDGFRHEYLVDAGNGALLATKAKGRIKAAGRKRE